MVRTIGLVICPSCDLNLKLLDAGPRVQDKKSKRMHVYEGEDGKAQFWPIELMYAIVQAH